MVEAKYYKKEENKAVRCTLCPHNCYLKENQVGICRVRKNISGKLYATSYGKVSAIALDPIEKKPLYHVFPGSQILSIGTIGCNFRCPFCQNWHISQDPDYPTEYISPENLLKIAKQYRETIGMAYTYSEPLIWFEYVLDCAKLFKKEGFINVLVTNGFINKEPLLELLEYVDALNIDLKYFNNKSYKKYSLGDLNIILRNIEIAHQKAFVELTHLVVTGINDNEEEFRALVKWIASLDKSIPLHISRYYPSYNWNMPPTSPEILKRFYQIAKEYLDYVYLGNINIEGTNNTYCPKCNSLLIERRGYFTKIANLDIEKGKCKVCGQSITGLFNL